MGQKPYSISFVLNCWKDYAINLKTYSSLYAHEAYLSGWTYLLCAKDEGLDEDRITFKVASSTNFPIITNEGYDLIAFFDCLHDMGDPEGADGVCTKSIKEA